MCRLDIERSTRRYSKPVFGFTDTLVDGERVPVYERAVWQRPFCQVISFDRVLRKPKPQPILHIMAVCQPSVPVIAAIARMEAENDPFTPRSMTLMGGPIDTRRSPTAVNQVAEKRGIEWFRQHCIVKVPPA